MSVAETAAEAPVAGRRDLLALAAALVSLVLWASAFVGIRAAGEAISPGPLAATRLLIGAAILGAFVLVRREAFPRRRDLAAIAVCGALWFGAYNLALNASEQHIDAGTAAMLVSIGTLLVPLLAGLVLGEGFPPRLFAGGAVGFAGVAVIGLATAERGVSSTGTFLALLAAASYAAGLIVQKSVLGRVSALQTTFLCCCVGALTSLPFATGIGGELAGAGAGPLAWTIYLGVFPTAVAFTTWAFALARSPAGRLAPLTYLVPPLSVLLGWAILSETPPVAALAGGALCLLGVAVARRG